MLDLVLALGIGIVSGLRTFTSLAAVFLMRGGVAGWTLGALALAEYVYDVSPNCGSRTAFPGNVARIISGAVAGWFLTASRGGSAPAGAVTAVAGALIGTYGGSAVRRAASARIGNLPAGLTESLVAAALAALIVTR